jgi:hypothetical protein
MLVLRPCFCQLEASSTEGKGGVPVMTAKHNPRLSKLMSKQREISGYFLVRVFIEVVRGVL